MFWWKVKDTYVEKSLAAVVFGDELFFDFGMVEGKLRSA